MRKALFAAALLATAATAVPLVAFSQRSDADMQTAQAGGPAGAAGLAPSQAGPGPEGMNPMMRRRMMMRREMMGMRQSPQQRCIDRVAHRAGFLAYIGVKLNLTTAQRPLWDKLEGVGQQEAQSERQVCDQMKPGNAETIIDRMNARQQLMSARLAGLEAAKEPMAALYKVLTPEQRMILDHPMHRP